MNQDTRYRAAQENGVHANDVSVYWQEQEFSRICHSVLPYPNGTKFTVELTSRPDLQDPSSRFRDMSQQNLANKNFLIFFFFIFLLFAHFAQITITRVCVL